MASPLHLTKLTQASENDIAQFIYGLATRSHEALSVLPPEKGEDPIFQLVSFFETASMQDRCALANGTLLALQIHLPFEGMKPRELEATTPILIFASRICRDLDRRNKKRIITPLRRWLNFGAPEQSRLAAMALSKLKDLEALEALETFQRAHPRSKEIVATLLMARSEVSLFDTFAIEAARVAFAFDDPFTNVAIMDCLERMVETDIDQTVVAVRSTIGKWPVQSRFHVASMLIELNQRLYSTEIAKLVDELHAEAPASRVTASYRQTAELIEQIEGLLKSQSGDEAFASAQFRLGEYISGIGAPSFADQWLLFCSHAESRADTPLGEQLLELYSTAAIEFAGSPHFVRLLQDRYFGAIDAGTQRGRREKLITVTRNDLTHLKSATRAKAPEKIRVARSPYAEDIYLEIFLIIVKAMYPTLTIEIVESLDWDKIDEALINGDIDIGMNNDDLLDFDDWEEGDAIYRMSGTPFYVLDKFTLLVDSEFLQARGVSASACQAARDKSRAPETLFKEADTENVVLKKVLADARVTAAPNSVLQTMLQVLYQQMGIRLNNFIGRTTDLGLIGFFDGRFDAFLAGPIHTEYALSKWKQAVPVLNLPEAVEGRLYARKKFIEEYPGFADELLRLLNETRSVWERPDVFAFGGDFESYLLNHLNLTMKAAYRDSLVTVSKFADLRTILYNSRLEMDDNRSRKWELYSRGGVLAPEGSKSIKT